MLLLASICRTGRVLKSACRILYTPFEQVVERPAGSDEMTLLVECSEPAEDPGRIAETVQAVTKLRGTVSRVPAGSLPVDGKLIEDRRNLN